MVDARIDSSMWDANRVAMLPARQALFPLTAVVIVVRNIDVVSALNGLSLVLTDRRAASPTQTGEPR